MTSTRCSVSIDNQIVGDIGARSQNKDGIELDLPIGKHYIGVSTNVKHFDNFGGAGDITSVSQENEGKQFEINEQDALIEIKLKTKNHNIFTDSPRFIISEIIHWTKEELDKLNESDEQDDDSDIDDEKKNQIEEIEIDNNNLDNDASLINDKNEKSTENPTNKRKFHISFLIIGILLVVLATFLIWFVVSSQNNIVVTIDDKVYKINEVKEITEGQYSIELLLKDIDNVLLTRIYPEDDEMLRSVNDEARYHFEAYQKYYDYTEKEFLETFGFKNYNEFINYLKLDYRYQKYLNDYIRNALSEEEIQQYYSDNVFGAINTQYILIENISNDDNAKKLATEIINKLNSGTTWNSILRDYKNKITFENLGYVSWNNTLTEEFFTALKNMSNNSYSKEPVKATHGYYIIYRFDQKEISSFVDERDAIIDAIINDKKANDSDLLYKILISLREENNINFSNKKMKEKYDKYCKEYK